MNKLRQFINCYTRPGPFSLPVCGFGMLFLMLASPLALAKPDCSDHPSCKDGQGPPESPPFWVAVVEHEGSSDSPLYHPSDDLSCLAKAHNHFTNFDAVFGDQPCAALTYSSYAGPDLYLTTTIGFHVTRDKKSGDVVSVWLQGQGVVEDEVLMHFGDEMYATNPNAWVDLPDEDGNFIIHLHADNVMLTRCDAARVKPKTVCNLPVGTFAIVDMLYFTALSTP